MRNQSLNFSLDTNKIIYNFSSYRLTNIEKSVLCKDLQFVIPPSKLKYADFMFSFELLFHDIHNSNLCSSQSKASKSNILDTTFSSCDSFNKYKIKRNLSN